MFQPRKKHSFLKLTAILIFSAAAGMFLGYASVRFKSFPFYEKLNNPSPKAKEEEQIQLPSYEPIYTNLTENNEIPKEDPVPTPTEVPAESTSTDYIVRCEADRVYLFKVATDGTITPEYTLPININSLKEEDKKLLYSGINIKSKQELASLLEDFGS